MHAMVIRIKHPAGAWCQQISEGTDASVRVLSCYKLDEERFLEVAEIRSPNWPEILDDLNVLPTVHRTEVLASSSDSAQVRLTVDPCVLATLVQETAIMPQLPFELHSGWDHWLVICDRERVRSFLDELAAAGTEAALVHSGEFSQSHLLTPRQQEYLALAVTEGYYDYPRRISLTKLAAAIGIAKTTLSESLQIVEAEVMKKFLDEPDVMQQQKRRARSDSR